MYFHWKLSTFNLFRLFLTPQLGNVQNKANEQNVGNIFIQNFNITSYQITKESCFLFHPSFVICYEELFLNKDEKKLAVHELFTCDIFSSLVRKCKIATYNWEIQQYIKHYLKSSLASFFLTNNSFFTNSCRFIWFIVRFTNLEMEICIIIKRYYSK